MRTPSKTLNKPTHTKANGVHYTPLELAAFLASVTAEYLVDHGEDISVLDPACGDGALLTAFAEAVSPDVRQRLILYGYETDSTALERASSRLNQIDVCAVQLVNQDFLDVVGPVGQQLDLFESVNSKDIPHFDAVIANPPYVRTQILGAEKAQALARRFELTGRVDLYQAFVRAIAEILKEDGVVGLLTSNRYLTIKSGVSLRRLLAQSYLLRSVYDLGDTKLFAAAVLPAILVASKNSKAKAQPCRFYRAYEDRTSPKLSTQRTASVLTALRDPTFTGRVNTSQGAFRVETGMLAIHGDDDIWTLTTRTSRDWINTVDQHRRFTFGEIGRVRVGIKTTADEVFIQDCWQDIPLTERPEAELIRPLIRHIDAGRWSWSGKSRQAVLYPHMTIAGKRQVVDLRHFPRAARYFETHRERLSRRHYVLDSGRQWYEIWVPHNPDEWARPKLVYPDIAEHPRFFLDSSGAIVNGDCYWITLRKGADPDWLMLMLAVANSSFITKFYDVVFHNKLYAGRRRFMTQYVNQFPLPDIEGNAARKAIHYASRLVEEKSVNTDLEVEIDRLVWKAFGLVEETAR